MRKIRTPHQNVDGKIFSWMVLILGIGVGLTVPIFPNYVKTILDTDSAVSIFYAVMAVISLIGSLLSTILFTRFQRTSILKASFIISSAAFFFLIFVTSIFELSFLNTIRAWFILFLSITLSLFVRDFAKSKNLGAQEGLFFKYSNIGIFLGPLIGGFLGASGSYEVVFIFAALVLLFGLFYFYTKHIIEKHPAIIEKKQSKTSLLKNARDFFKDKDRTFAYLMALNLMIWVQFKRIYAPLYVIATGYLSSVTGLIYSLGILPYIFLEVKVGEYADKKGIKLPVSLGFLIIAISMFLIFVSPFPILNFLLLIVANIGGAFIEPIQESYLFKNLPKEDEERLYGIYMTYDSVSFFLAPAIGALVLAFLSFNYLFLIFAILALFAALASHLNLKNS